MSYKTNLGEHLTFKNGKTSPERNDSWSVPVFGSNGQIGFSQESNNPRKTIVIGRVGTYCGSVHFSDDNCWVSDNAIACHAKNPDESHFWKHCLIHLNLNKHRGGSGQPLLNQTTLKSVDVTIPKSQESRIATGQFLELFDNKIANNKAMNQTLEKLAQRIFKSWFIDFDPVKANKEGLPFDGLSPEIQALFPSEFEDSELGMIPKGWAAEELSSLININPRRTIKKGTVTHHIDMKALPTSSMSIDEVGSKEFKSGTKFINHDTLLARITPCLENGKTAYVNCIPGNDIAWGSTEFIVMNPKDEYLREYTYLLARSDELRAYAIKNMTGTSGRQRVSGTLVGEFKVSKPNQAVLEAFHKVTASLFMKIATNTENSVALEKIRDRLLPKLISGQISVGEATQELAEAV